MDSSSKASPYPRIGIVGVGHLGRHHARVASQSSASVGGIFDIDEPRAYQVASELGIRVFSTLDELLDHSDAVVVATPAASHFATARIALEERKHCLVEKPLVTDPVAADTLVSLARRHDLVLAVGHSERFNPALEHADQFIRNPLYVEVTRVAPFPGRGADVDVVKDLMVHDLEIVLHWMGSDPVEMRAVGVALVTDKVDMANVRLEFAHGQVATLTASRASPAPMRVIRVFQRGGYASVDMGTQKIRFVRQTAEGLTTEETVVEGPEPLKAELDDFLEAVRTGARPRVSGEDGARVLRLAHDIVAHIDSRLSRLGASR
ncbi:Gfo/Idh/MocA family oxidoreductase [Candidatus Fermentibacteria bacterium]|nr:Gfo/Idh/MocA family oxidoreductase [Candidatus Fermentibacteria bacterium]